MGWRKKPKPGSETERLVSETERLVAAMRDEIEQKRQELVADLDAEYETLPILRTGHELGVRVEVLTRGINTLTRAGQTVGDVKAKLQLEGADAFVMLAAEQVNGQAPSRYVSDAYVLQPRDTLTIDPANIATPEEEEALAKSLLLLREHLSKDRIAQDMGGSDNQNGD